MINVEQVPSRLRSSDGSTNVPAVVRTIAILNHLSVEGQGPATATEIANALGLNVSTCFNILKTLAAGHYVAFNPRSKTYELGIGVRILADAVDKSDHIHRLAREQAEELARVAGVTALLVRWTDDGDFIVTDKVESPRRFRISTSVGQRFPWYAALLAKAYFAWQQPERVDELLRRLPVRPGSANPISNPVRWRRDLAMVRQRGYATSLGEYQPDMNAVGAPVFDRDDEVCVLIVLSGFSFDITPDSMRQLGPLVRDAAARVTTSIGGRFPAIDRLPPSSSQRSGTT